MRILIVHCLTVVAQVAGALSIANRYEFRIWCTTMCFKPYNPEGAMVTLPPALWELPGDIYTDYNLKCEHFLLDRLRSIHL